MLTIIAGSRDAREHHVIRAINECPWKEEITQVISGTARGSDRYGEKWARRSNIPVLKMPAEWDMYGLSSGPRRNKEMAENADCLIAIWNGSSSGTANMIAQAKRFCLRTMIYFYPEDRIEFPEYKKDTVQYSLFTSNFEGNRGYVSF